jgi:hypothetical protein
MKQEIPLSWMIGNRAATISKSLCLCCRPHSRSPAKLLSLSLAAHPAATSGSAQQWVRWPLN